MSSPSPRSSHNSSETLSGALLCSLALLSAAPPLGTDMYLSTFVTMANDLDTSAAMVQLTLTAFMVGMAIGQLVIGPVSDAIGRRKILITGAAVFLVTSIGAAVAPSIVVLIALRALMGLAGGSTVVLSRTIVADKAHGRAAAKAFSMLMMIQGLAPVIAPVIGGLLAGPIGWRGIFGVLAGFNVVMLVASIFIVPESLPPEARSKGGAKIFFATAKRVLTNRLFVGYMLVFAFGFGVMFAYISASPFILQGIYGLSQLHYSLAFALNAVVMTIVSMLNARLVDTINTRLLLIIGLVIMVIGAAGLLLSGLATAPLWVIMVLFVITVAGVALILGNSTALATDALRGKAAGTGSGIMGALQFLVAGLVSPLVGLGDNATVSMAIVMLISLAIAAIGGLGLTARANKD